MNDIVYIQRDAYPHQINERQGNRIINNYKEEKDCSKSGNDSGYDSGHDFDDFNDGSGGATSEW